jgi:hypothetical protein
MRETEEITGEAHSHDQVVSVRDDGGISSEDKLYTENKRKS